jgi:hypothetical protein
LQLLIDNTPELAGHTPKSFIFIHCWLFPEPSEIQ